MLKDAILQTRKFNYRDAAYNFCITPKHNHIFSYTSVFEKLYEGKQIISLVKQDFHVYKHSGKYGLRANEVLRE